jgi:hypothetical protein
MKLVEIILKKKKKKAQTSINLMLNEEIDKNNTQLKRNHK